MPSPHFIYNADDVINGDLFPALCGGCPLCDEPEPAELPECDGSCTSFDCGYEPDECSHCELYGHACHRLCVEEGCPCHAL